MFKNLKQRFQNERGLTLVELLAVIVILAIISVIAFVYISGVIDNSKKDAHIANAQQIISAAELYEATGGDIDVGSSVKVSELQKNNFLEDNILEPWDKEKYKDIEDDDAAKVDKADEDDDNPFKVSLKNNKGDCNINGATKSDLSEGRDNSKVCTD